MAQSALHSVVADFGETLHDMLDSMKSTAFSPDDEKTARKYTSQEVADFLGVTTSYLRKAHHDGRMPEVEQRPGGVRLYTLEELEQVRINLTKTAKDPLKFLPGRELAPSRKLQVLAMTTFKGGVGKTTSSCMLGQWLALRGYRVLLIDADPQASLTNYFGIDASMEELPTLYDAIRYDDEERGESALPMADVIIKTYFHRLDLVPSGIQLAEFEHEAPLYANQQFREDFSQRMSSAIASVESNYDVVIIDCPPQLGFTTLSALGAATTVIMPVTPSQLDVASTAQFCDMASEYLKVLADRVGTHHVDEFRFLISRYDTSESAHEAMVTLLRHFFPEHVLESMLLKSSAVSEAALTHETIFDVQRSKMTAKTYKRMLDSVSSVGAEIEALLQKTWGQP